MKGYKIPLLSKVTQTVVPTEPNWSNFERREIRIAISFLLDKSAIRQCQCSKGQFISRIFLVPKHSGDFRLVLNLKLFNFFVKTDHFKLEDHKTVIRLLSKDCLLASIDLTDAYYLIPVREEDRKFLRFYFEGVLYEFNCLPFGLSSAPYVFTKILKPLFAKLRAEGFKSVVYLDDFLVLGDSRDDCSLNVRKTVEWLKRLGFLINEQKSQLIPKREICYLGFVYNSEDMSVSLPENKVQKLRDQLYKIDSLKQTSIRNFAQVIGLLVSACPAIPYGWLYTKRFERAKFLGLLDSNGNYDAVMKIPRAVKEDLSWWMLNLSNSKNPIRNFVFSLEIFSDASLSGWGIYSEGRSSHGFWNRDDLKQDINYLELCAAFFGLKCFAGDRRNCSVLLRIDNTTAISYVNRMGSVKFERLSEVARNIWKWCEERNIWIYASYIPSKENIEADLESRRLKTETEFELSTSGFERIISKLGVPEIDLFASRANNKCKRFVS